MALSNKFGALVLSTGNKSEMGVGYCTLYGDMAGGLAVIIGCPQDAGLSPQPLCRIPEASNSARHASRSRHQPNCAPIKKTPTRFPLTKFSMRFLRTMLRIRVQPKKFRGDHDFDLALVKEVIRMVERNEYKRQQAAPGIKISPKAFGYGRRFPIAAKTDI